MADFFIRESLLKAKVFSILSLGVMRIRDGVSTGERFRFPAMWDTETAQRMKMRLREVSNLPKVTQPVQGRTTVGLQNWLTLNSHRCHPRLRLEDSRDSYQMFTVRELNYFVTHDA